MNRADDWEDDGPQRRRDRWGEEVADSEGAAYLGDRAERSAVVTTAGIFTLILGGLVLLAGLCGGTILVIAGTAEFGHIRQGEQVAILLVLLLCVVVLCWGIGAVASGVGLMNRRNWARILTLILGGFGAIAGLIFLFIAGALWFVPTPGPDAGIMILAYLLYLFLGLLFTGYCLWTYLILLNARYSAEFR